MGSGAVVEEPAPSAAAAVTATVLLTDIADSTHLWERHPDEMELVVNQHHDLVASAVTARHGRVIKSTGDGVLALFEEAAEAVGSAIEIQRTIPTLHWPAVDVLSVRIGVDTGICRLGRGDVLGRPPNLAARLQSSGHGAQILVSDATAVACAGRLPDGVGLRDLGSFLMRGFDTPIRVHQAEARGLVDSFPPLRAPSPASTTSHPTSSTSSAARRSSPSCLACSPAIGWSRSGVLPVWARRASPGESPGPPAAASMTACGSSTCRRRLTSPESSPPWSRRCTPSPPAGSSPSTPCCAASGRHGQPSCSTTASAPSTGFGRSSASCSRHVATSTC